MCFRIFTNFRDRDVCFQREFTAFIRALRLLVQTPSDVLPASDIAGLLAVRTLDWCLFDEEKFRALFGQYFRLDISSQRSYVYRENQQFLSGLCTALVTDYQRGDILSLAPFDAVLVIGGSKDRLVDSLLLTCLSLISANS